MIFSQNDILGLKMKILKLLGIQPSYEKFEKIPKIANFIKIPNPGSHNLEMGHFWADSAKIDA